MNAKEWEKIEGKLCKDQVSGFEGTAVGYAVYITGCVQVVLAPRVDKDGKLGDSIWFDLSRVELCGFKPVPKPPTSDPAGGPQRDAPKV